MVGRGKCWERSSYSLSYSCRHLVVLTDERSSVHNILLGYKQSFDIFKVKADDGGDVCRHLQGWWEMFPVVAEVGRRCVLSSLMLQTPLNTSSKLQVGCEDPWECGTF